MHGGLGFHEHPGTVPDTGEGRLDRVRTRDAQRAALASLVDLTGVLRATRRGGAAVAGGTALREADDRLLTGADFWALYPEARSRLRPGRPLDGQEGARAMILGRAGDTSGERAVADAWPPPGLGPGLGGGGRRQADGRRGAAQGPWTCLARHQR